MSATKNIRQTIENIRKLSPELANQVARFAKERTYGLVWEDNLPEATRYYKRRPQRGNTVNILPERGHMETDENKIPWIVDNIRNGRVIVHYKDEQRELPIEDVVVVAGHDDVIYPGLKVIDKVERGNADDPYHMVINAENYHALEMLSYAYTGKVDCIYIDPPYNTGAKDWKYNNDYVGRDDRYRHSKWLSFMERRLLIAKKLLRREDGVLIVAIDDSEMPRTIILLEQLFSEYDISTVIINHHPQGGAADNIMRTHEYALFVIPKGKKLLMGEPVGAGDEIWSLVRGGTDRRNLRIGRPNSFYAIYVDKGTHNVVGVGPRLAADEPYDATEAPDGCVAVFPIGRDGTERVWRYERSSMESHINNGDILCSERMMLHVRKHRSEKYSPVSSVWTDGRYNAGTYGTSLLYTIFGKENRFSYPKSLYTVKDCINTVVRNRKDAIVVDFFAGSGTTAHATMLLNHLDGGHRRCISVTNNEVSAEEEKKFIKAGLRPYDEEWQKYGIARYITWERVKAAITGINTLGEPIKGDYKFTEEFPMSEGFKENAIFCELTYESEWDVRLDYAFDAIAPILWMQAGCRGGIITKIGRTFRYTDNYAVLFDYSQASNFVKAVKAHPSIGTVYVVTDDQRQFSDICNRLKSRNIKVHRLYKSYLETFVILGEGYSD